MLRLFLCVFSVLLLFVVQYALLVMGCLIWGSCRLWFIACCLLVVECWFVVGVCRLRLLLGVVSFVLSRCLLCVVSCLFT